PPPPSASTGVDTFETGVARTAGGSESFDESSIGHRESDAQKKKVESKAFGFEGRTIVSNQGRVASLMLPNKFALAERIDSDFCTVFEYHIPNYQGMKIGHWLWTNAASELSDTVAASFESILGLEPHVLSSDEIELLEDVIPQEVFGYDGAFDVIGLRTEDYGSKTVLVLEVKWWDVDRKAYGIFYPSDGSWKQLESLHFEGADIDFRQTFLSAKAAFMRMRWRR
ncbi:MAG: hypothetical protein SGJ27_08520, partial [Candidatus Melainabacteria bacterium]|nr:hypothetical protein [Candidatus Melainabacteria bacterium]